MSEEEGERKEQGGKRLRIRDKDPGSRTISHTIQYGLVCMYECMYAVCMSGNFAISQINLSASHYTTITHNPEHLYIGGYAEHCDD